MANEQNPSTTAPAPVTTDSTAEQPSPKFMTADDFNGAMTARDRRLMKQFEKTLADALAGARQAAPVVEEGAESDPSATQEPADAKKGQGSDVAIKRATAKIEALHRQMQAKEEAAAKEKAELLQRQEKSDVLAALASAGVTTAKGAYAMLKEEGRIKRSADGELVIMVVKDYAGAKMEEEVPIAAGIKEWLATDDGKHFALPRGGGDGSGTVVRGGQRGGAPLSKEEAKRDADRAIAAFILGNR